MTPPTPQQSKVLTTARAMYRAADGVPPTLKAIAIKLGVSKVTIHEHVTQLKAKGHIDKRYRSIVPLGMSELRPSRDLVTRTMTALSVAGALPLAEEWGRLLRGEA
jgi:biotin operon repressor